MEIIATFFNACSTLQRQKTELFDEDLASEIQLNAFEFRNYRTSLDAPQQQIVERIVNSWCAMLVKGKMMKVEGIDDKIFLDKDMLMLEYQNEFYPLKTISRMEMFKDVDEMMAGSAAPFGLDVTFEGAMGDISLKFNFEHERQRLHFALTMRILRTRDPTLDPSANVTVIGDEEDEDDHQTFGMAVNAQHYNIDNCIPIVFSVSDLKLYQKLQSTSRHTYLEFFVRYPRQDKFLYAKSPTTHIPQQVLLTEDAALRRKKEKKDENEEEEEKKKEEMKRQVLGDEIPICAMRFDLKNVKMRIPKVPHQIFGRLMAKDDYFPTAIGTFDFQVSRSHLMNKMKDENERKKGSKKEKDLPETMRIPLYSSWKVKDSDNKEEKNVKLGTLTLRLMGYVTETKKPRSEAGTPSARSGKNAATPSEKSEGGDEEEEGEESEEAQQKTSKDNASESASGSSSSSSASSSESESD
mmetsp:Transcript_148199/g.385086  ORF Transcript_148199/g.385086 Transcript_148199/m.385086 type:complete len:467 (-) Transcript_148199:60-1460(-)